MNYKVRIIRGRRVVAELRTESADIAGYTYEVWKADSTRQPGDEMVLSYQGVANLTYTWS